MKKWYESRTIWVNVLTLLALILGTIAQWPELQQYSPQVLGALSITNLILRFATTGSVK
jgi:hypothetical protein